MCVVTLLPLNDGFVLTSNRDEHMSRLQAVLPQTYQISNQSIIFPKDPQGGGTWLATSGPTTVCLLNGAFVNQMQEQAGGVSPARKSRGLVVLDYFGYREPQAFADAYNFGGIEPFTMVVINHTTKALDIHELRWNGQQIYLRAMAINQPHIWSSVTLYSTPQAELRKSWLVEFLHKHTVYTPEDLFNFHQTAGDGNPNHDFVMDRTTEPHSSDRVRTVSITQIIQTGSEQVIRYKDLMTANEMQVTLTYQA